jgi:hypothetical protein
MINIQAKGKETGQIHFARQTDGRVTHASSGGFTGEQERACKQASTLLEQHKDDEACLVLKAVFDGEVRYTPLGKETKVY